MAGKKIIMDINGYIWLVQANGNVYENAGAGWSLKGGVCATDIASGPDGSIYVLSCSSNSKGHEVF